MHPAYSVIFFTTASGAGYGLLGLLGLVGLNHGQASSLGFGLTSWVLGLGLVIFGLLSSLFHLGHPERAWRALSQWRTSWLSREGVLSTLGFIPILGFGLIWTGLLPAPKLIAPLGLLLFVLCFCTVFATGKIYSSLRTIPAWYQPLTVAVYLLFALVTGSALLMVVSVVFGRFQIFQLSLSLISLVGLIIVKLLYWQRTDQAAAPLTLAEATGLPGDVRQWELPHTSPNFVQKEMGFVIARRHARKLRAMVISLMILGLGLQLACFLSPWLSWPAAAVLLLAACFERWLFFAEARHVSALYYGG